MKPFPQMVSFATVILGVVLLLPGGGLGYEFSDRDEEARFQSLITELRCLVCQNQSLADSSAELAGDLRDEVYGMIKSGETDAEIVAFLVDRYGDFVLYRPPIKRSTYLLWFGPLLVVALAAAFLWREMARRRLHVDAELSKDDRSKIERILAGDQKSSNSD